MLSGVRLRIRELLERERRVNGLAKKYGVSKRVAREIMLGLENGVLSEEEVKRIIGDYRKRRIRGMLRDSEKPRRSSRSPDLLGLIGMPGFEASERRGRRR